MTDEIKVTNKRLAPNAAGGGPSGSSQALSEGAMWEQMCHVQSDMRKNTIFMRELVDISKNMLSSQQKSNDLIEKMVYSTEQMVGKMSTMIEKSDAVLEKTDVMIENIDGLLEKTTNFIDENADNTKKLLESIEEMVIDNEVNMSLMGSNIELIAQSALTVAYSQSSEEEVSGAADKAIETLKSDPDEKEALLQLGRALTRQKVIDRKNKEKGN